MEILLVILNGEHICLREGLPRQVGLRLSKDLLQPHFFLLLDLLYEGQHFEVSLGRLLLRPTFILDTLQDPRLDPIEVATARIAWPLHRQQEVKQSTGVLFLQHCEKCVLEQEQHTGRVLLPIVVHAVEQGLVLA